MFEVFTFTGTRIADMFDSLTHQPKNQILRLPFLASL